MPKIKIDNSELEVPAGTTVLDAAAKIGIEIPTLCYLKSVGPQTSCFVCLVKINKAQRLVPSCATICQEGMDIESETPEITAFRRSAIELLLAEHCGDCFAPCTNVCPAHMDIPTMMRDIERGDLHAAVVTVKRAIPLPATLGRICPELCEKGCRRNNHDSAVSICSLKRYVGDKDLQSNAPYLPPCDPDTGKRVAIVGSGPAGLTAAWFLKQHGHSVTIFDEHPLPGGALRYAIDEDRLPRAILDGEINLMKLLGIQFQMNVRIGANPALPDLQRDFDAILLAIGPVDQEKAATLGVDFVGKGIKVDRETLRTKQTAVFAAGSALVPAHYAIRAVADGQTAATSIHNFLNTAARAKSSSFASRLGKMSDVETNTFFANTNQSPRLAPHGDSQKTMPDLLAKQEASRCGHCDCSKLDNCRLRKVALRYDANPNKHKGARRDFQRQNTHPLIVYEPGKCILCGLCVAIAERAAEPLGLTFIGRGFNVEVGVPLNANLNASLQRVARECVAACPSGALDMRTNLPLTPHASCNDGPLTLSLPQLR